MCFNTSPTLHTGKWHADGWDYNQEAKIPQFMGKPGFLMPNSQYLSEAECDLHRELVSGTTQLTWRCREEHVLLWPGDGSGDTPSRSGFLSCAAWSSAPTLLSRHRVNAHRTRPVRGCDLGFHRPAQHHPFPCVRTIKNQVMKMKTGWTVWVCCLLGGK